MLLAPVVEEDAQGKTPRRRGRIKLNGEHAVRTDRRGALRSKRRRKRKSAFNCLRRFCAIGRIDLYIDQAARMNGPTGFVRNLDGDDRRTPAVSDEAGLLRQKYGARRPVHEHNATLEPCDFLLVRIKNDDLDLSLPVADIDAAPSRQRHAARSRLTPGEILLVRRPVDEQARLLPDTVLDANIDGAGRWRSSFSRINDLRFCGLRREPQLIVILVLGRIVEAGDASDAGAATPVFFR